MVPGDDWKSETKKKQERRQWFSEGSYVLIGKGTLIVCFFLTLLRIIEYDLESKPVLCTGAC